MCWSTRVEVSGKHAAQWSSEDAQSAGKSSVKKQLRSEEHLRLFIACRPALHSFRLNKVQLQLLTWSKELLRGFILRVTVLKHDVNVSNYTRSLETRSDHLITFTRVWSSGVADSELKCEVNPAWTPAFYQSVSHMWCACQCVFSIRPVHTSTRSHITKTRLWHQQQFLDNYHGVLWGTSKCHRSIRVFSQRRSEEAT